MSDDKTPEPIDAVDAEFKKLGDAFFDMRLAAGLTTKQLAISTGLTVSAADIDDIESADFGDITVDVLQDLATALGKIVRFTLHPL